MIPSQQKLELEFLKIYRSILSDKSKIDEATSAREAAELRSSTKPSVLLTLTDLDNLGAFDKLGQEREDENIQQNIIIDGCRAYAEKSYYAEAISQREKLVLDAVQSMAHHLLHEKHTPRVMQVLNDFLDQHGQNANVEKSNFNHYLKALKSAPEILSSFDNVKLATPSGYKPDNGLIQQINSKIEDLEKAIAKQGHFKIVHKAGIAGGLGLGLIGLATVIIGTVLVATGVGGPAGFALLGIGAATAIGGAAKSAYHAARLLFSTPRIEPVQAMQQTQKGPDSTQCVLKSIAYGPKVKSNRLTPTVVLNDPPEFEVRAALQREVLETISKKQPSAIVSPEGNNTSELGAHRLSA